MLLPLEGVTIVGFSSKYDVKALQII